VVWDNDPTKVQTVGTVEISGLERLMLQTGSGNDSLVNTRVATDDTFITGAGNNTVSAGDGNDTINGDSGNDTLDGGTGNDSLMGGTGNDSYAIDSPTDVISETSTLANEIDSVSSAVTWMLGSNLEKLTLTGALAINGTGNALANVLAGNTASNLLAGGAGHDTISGGSGGDTLDGDTGNDSLIGGTGNDRYVVQSSGDKVIEASSGGTDSVSSSITHTLPAEVENLTLTGTSALEGHGNSLNNTIVGNSGNNLLRGSTGNDTLTGGAGLDIFRFSSALNGSTNVDTVTDFNPADDILQLENSIFAKLTATGVLSTSFFRANTTGTASDGNDYSCTKPTPACCSTTPTATAPASRCWWHS
jgi:Ca2+-binding RTX toxin-like protein